MSENAPVRPPRVFVPDLASFRGFSEEVPLGREEREHVRSRRLRDGDEVVALDGKGARARGRLTRSGAAVALLSFEESSSVSSLPGEPANRVTVLLACAEPARVEWAIEKGTECGAAGFVLLDAERSQRAHVAALSKRIGRLIRIAEEATKQCDRTLVPFVEGPKSAEESLRWGRGKELLVAEPGGAVLLGPRKGPAVIGIGPEGGFAPAELTLFEKEGALRTSLGSRILRLETAVVVALARLVDSG